MNEEELKHILVEHQKWLKDYGGKRADLQGANLRGAHLAGADLRRADLQGAHLARADLEGMNYRPYLHILKLQLPDTKLRAWKYLVDGKSPYREAEYQAGKTYTETDVDADERVQCGKGLNVATLQWCLWDSSKADEFLEVEFEVRDIVAIPIATDGKFRVRKFKAVRVIGRKEAERLAWDREES